MEEKQTEINIDLLCKRKKPKCKLAIKMELLFGKGYADSLSDGWIMNNDLYILRYNYLTQVSILITKYDKEIYLMTDSDIWNYWVGCVNFNSICKRYTEFKDRITIQARKIIENKDFYFKEIQSDLNRNQVDSGIKNKRLPKKKNHYKEYFQLRIDL
jgi:hypothetical protein